MLPAALAAVGGVKLAVWLLALAEGRWLRSRAAVRRRTAELLRTNARAVSHGIMHGSACAKYAAQAFPPGEHLIFAMLRPRRCALRRLVVWRLMRKRLPSTLASVVTILHAPPAMQAASASATAFYAPLESILQ